MCIRDRLCLSILEEMNAKYGTEKVFSEEVKRHLAAYSWPGNIRELRNVIERLVIVSSGGDVYKRQHVGRAEGCFGLLDKMQVRQRDSRLPHRGQARCTVVVGEAFLWGHGRTIGLFPVFQIRFKRVRIVVHRPKGGLQLFGGTPGKRDDSNEKGNGADGGVASFHFFGLGNFPSDVKMVTKRLSYKKNQIISVSYTHLDVYKRQ